MFIKIVASMASLLALASAVSVTAPKQGDQWDLSQTNTVMWSSVATDPGNLTIVLIDHATTPATQLTVASGVNTADGKYAVTNFVAAPSSHYQISLLSSANAGAAILAQSPEFNVTKSGTAPTTTAGGATGTGSGSQPTKTGAAAAGGRGSGVAGAIAAGMAVFLL